MVINAGVTPNPGDHMTTYNRIVLASRPQGEVAPSNFRLETATVPALKDGEVLVRNHYLSLDPYMRMRMEDVKSYAAPQAIGETMIGDRKSTRLNSSHSQIS